MANFSKLQKSKPNSNFERIRINNVGKMADHRRAIERAIKSREDKKEDYVLRKDLRVTIYVISVQFASKPHD